MSHVNFEPTPMPARRVPSPATGDQAAAAATPPPPARDVYAPSLGAVEAAIAQRKALAELNALKQEFDARRAAIQPGDAAQMAYLLDEIAFRATLAGASAPSNVALIDTFRVAEAKLKAATTPQAVHAVLDGVIAVRRAYPASPAYQAEIRFRNQQRKRLNEPPRAGAGLPVGARWESFMQVMRGLKPAP